MSVFLGNIELPNIAIVAMPDSRTWTYAAQAVIEGTERRQAVARGAPARSLSLWLHAQFVPVQATIAALIAEADAFNVLVLQDIDGTLLGQVVIESVDVRPIFKLPDGFLVSASVEVKLTDPGAERRIIPPPPSAVLGSSGAATTTSTRPTENTSTPKEDVTSRQIARLP